MKAQPKATPSIDIGKILVKNKVVCVGSPDGINYGLYSPKRCKKCVNESLAVSVNNYYTLVYKQDTMRLKLLYDDYSPIKFKVDALLFQTGEFIIDLKEYEKTLAELVYPIIIEKLPFEQKAPTKED